MRCGHCRTQGVTVQHVKNCSYEEQMIRGIGRADNPYAANEPSEVLDYVSVAVEVPEPVTEAGFYQHGEEVYKVQVAVHGSGRLYAKRLIVAPDYDAPETPTHELPVKVRWEYAPGAIREIVASDRLTAEQAKAFSDLYGVCVFCTKPLTDERSIFAGYGEKCASNNGLPWGAVA